MTPVEDTPPPVISLKGLGLHLIRRLDPAANGQGMQRSGEHAGLHRGDAVSKSRSYGSSIAQMLCFPNR